jgi:glycosyltransferase involved in cell wall biosynthesis
MSDRPILLVTHAGVLGGAERVLLDWAEALERPAILAAPPGPLATAAAGAGHGVEAIPDRPLERRGRTAAAARDVVALARDIDALARRHRPAVIVASGQRAVLAAALARPHGARTLALHHDFPASPLVAQASARADAVVATSHAIAATLPRGTAVIHPGVDLRKHTTLPRPATPPRALLLGALVAWKRPELALEITARTPHLDLDIAGEPLDPASTLPAALRERAAHEDLHGRVRFLGRTDARAALADAHLLLHCAHREPFGLALVEALAAGRPVVAPAQAGPLEIVTPDAGRLYPPRDAAAAAEAIAATLNDDHAPAAARRRAETAFDGARAARTFARIVEHLV